MKHKKINNNRNTVASPIIHYSLSTIHCPKGITLIEVLASIFVISIGLLGVLAVIPFGIFQVSKAREAENTANMLAAAADDVKTRELTKKAASSVVKRPPTAAEDGYNIPPGQRNTPDDGYAREDSNNPNCAPYKRSYIENPDNQTFDCRRVFVVDPLGTTFPDAGSGNTDRFSKVDLGTPIDCWQKMMRGQDDLVFTTHRTRLSRAIEKRTDFSGQGNRIDSSGKYTWFCTFAVDPKPGFSGNVASVPLNDLSVPINVDLLGCYNRTPDDPVAEREVDVTGYMQTLNGAQITLKGAAADLDLSKTKQIFVSWSETIGSGQRYVGRWCNVAYAPKNLDRNGAKTIVVTNNPNVPALPDTIGNTPRALIVDGIIYHKRVDGMPLF